MYFWSSCFLIKSSIKLGNKFHKVFKTFLYPTMVSWLFSICAILSDTFFKSPLFLPPKKFLSTKPSTAIESSWMCSDFWELCCIKKSRKWCMYVHGNKLILSHFEICFSISYFFSIQKNFKAKHFFLHWDRCTCCI